MSTTNNDSQLRTFKLIDKEGWLENHIDNPDHYDGYFINDQISGSFDKDGDLTGGHKNAVIIGSDELKFFREVTNELPSEDSTNLPEQPESQLPYQHLIDDCKAVDSSLCIHKEGVVFLWEDSEYVINSPEDYDNLINSIKVLQSLQKLYTIESLTNEGE